MKFIVTSGPTRSYLDEIRYISNYSTGALGTLVAKQAAARGHKVIQISGKGSIAASGKSIKNIEIETIEELLAVLRKELKKNRKRPVAVIHAMAVLDFIAPKKIKGKVRSDRKSWTVRLVRSPKVMKEIKKMAPRVKLAGFKLEYKAGKKALLNSAKKLLEASAADYVVANDFSGIKAGKHTAMIVGKSGFIKGNISGKERIAAELLKTIEGVKC